ncbi:transposon tf2-12 polyprotein [Plakobranchus ocellatus]|uniref:Transposon tf2-12 polyprotein n=1 Tax=Plakobranchus ocellatus TaxID=259542 RepID=A0AAV3Y2H8_9GAST|nr:transposon tf2-12 polyprotein [Plakobranchus ocellatus]
MLVRGMDYVVDYTDDLLIHTPTSEDEVRTLRKLFRRLQQANFTVRSTKCGLRARKIDVLGHRLGDGAAISFQDEIAEKKGR